MSTYNGRWIPTPYVTISMGIGKNAIKSLIFTTLSRLNKKKYIVDVNITQTSKTTVEYVVNLKYYPNTFERASQPNDLEMKLNLALRDESTRDIYISFGYESNSPYTGTAESSPIFKGIITNMTSQVNQNYISYTIKGYGCDVLLSYFVNIDKQIDKYIKQDTICETFIRKQILNDGNFAINDDSSLKYDIQFQNINLDETFFNLLVGSITDYTIDAFIKIITEYITNYSSSIANLGNNIANPNEFANALQQLAEAQKTLKELQDSAQEGAVQRLSTDGRNYLWNKVKKAISFENLTNELVDSENITNQVSANKEKLTDKSQFSVYEAIEIINRLLNCNLLGKVYNLKCIIEPYSSNSSKYDGTIKIYDASKIISSKKNFYWGLWNTKGVLSNKSTVISWSCDYNATAKLFGKDKISTSDDYDALCNNINTDVKVNLDADGEINYSLVSSQTKSIDNIDYNSNINQNTQYATMLNIVQNTLDYPYAAKITVLGIVDALQIGKDTINVYVFVNGAEHFTSGEYLITGYSHSIGSQGFQTSYDLLKIPSALTPESKNNLLSAVVNNKSLTDLSLEYNTSSSSK